MPKKLEMMKQFQKKRIMIIDGNNLLHRCYHKFTQLTSRSGESTSMIYGFPYVTSSLLVKFGPQELYIVFDGGRSIHRKSILPDYKKRDQKLGFDYEDFQKQKEIVMELMVAFGATIIYQKGTEADDWVYKLLRSNYLKDSYTTIVSSDKDFHQLLEPGITIFNPFNDKRINHRNLKTFYGYEADQAVDYLILDGDKSDNIPGYPQMGPKRITQFLEEHKSIRKFLKSNAQHKLIDRDKLESIYKQNRALIDLKWYYRKYLRAESIPFLNSPGKKKLISIHIDSISNKYQINTFQKPEFLSKFRSLL